MNKAIKKYTFRVINGIFLAALAALCLLPIIHILAVSFSNQAAVSANQVGLIPRGFTFASYKMVAKRNAFWQAFGISVERVIIGVIINTVITVLMAYPLSKKESEFPARKIYVWLLIFVMIFDGGLVPNYILIKDLNLFDTIWALVLPTAVPIYNIILTMNFMKQLPDTIEEAAMVDGAREPKHICRMGRQKTTATRPMTSAMMTEEYISCLAALQAFSVSFRPRY